MTAFGATSPGGRTWPSMSIAVVESGPRRGCGRLRQAEHIEPAEACGAPARHPGMSPTTKPDMSSATHTPKVPPLTGPQRASRSPARWGCSSDGRALQSHCRGQRFDSAQLHHPLHLSALIYLLSEYLRLWRGLARVVSCVGVSCGGPRRAPHESPPPSPASKVFCRALLSEVSRRPVRRHRRSVRFWHEGRNLNGAADRREFKDGRRLPPVASTTMIGMPC